LNLMLYGQMGFSIEMYNILGVNNLSKRHIGFRKSWQTVANSTLEFAIHLAKNIGEYLKTPLLQKHRVDYAKTLKGSPTFCGELIKFKRLFSC
jgi:hypothetical protein